MSKGGGTQTTTSTQSIDPRVWAQVDKNVARATDIADQGTTPYTGQFVSGLSGNEQLANMFAPGLLSAGSGALNQGVQGAQGLLNSPITPAQTNAYTYNTAPAQTYNAAPSSINRGDVRNVNGGNLLEGIQQYQNPFQQQVIDATMGDIELQRQRALGGNQDAAIAARAFGGNRQGVADSLTNEAYGRQAAQTAAGLRAQGFDTAAGLAGQDANRGFAAQQANQGMDLNVAGQNAQNQQSANLANASAGNANSMFNAGAINQANANNAGAWNARDLYNAQAQNSAMGLNQQTGLAASGLLGQLGGQQQSLLQNGLNGLLTTGSNARGVDQASLNAAYQEWLRQQNQPFIGQSLINQSLGLLPQGGTTTSTAPKQDNSAQMLGGIGGLLSGVGALAAL